MSAILVVTGASGAGKTAAVRALAERGLPGVECFHFDSIGVPSLEDMQRLHGGADLWQADATDRWIKQLAGGPAEVTVLDGQTRPSFVHAALARAGNPAARVVLFDCAAEERGRRLAGPRGQPELASSRMDAWAVYLRGEADALGLPVLDTTAITIEAAASMLEAEIQRLRRYATDSRSTPHPNREVP